MKNHASVNQPNDTTGRSCSRSGWRSVVIFAMALGLVSIPQAFGQGLVALYRFAETNTSQPAADSSSNALNGAYEGGVTPGELGVFTNGLDTNSAAFDGQTGYVLAPQSSLFNSQDLTIEFWMNLNGEDVTYGMPVARGAPNNPWTIQIQPVSQTTSPRQMQWIVKGTGLFTPAVVQPNTWQHIAVVQGGTNAAIYVNGQLVTSGALPLPQPPTAGILIGRRGDGYFLDGSMDNVALFDSVLSTNQMQSDMNNGPTPGGTNLIALWEFNETGTNQPAADLSGHGLNGNYEGGVTLAASFTNTFSNAAQFDGSTGYVLVPPNPVFSPANLTIEFWINVAGSSYANYAMPVTCDITNGQYNGNIPWTVQIDPATSATDLRAISWVAYGINVDATAVLPPDSWHFVVISQTGNTGQIYVDGALVASGNNAGLADPSVYIGQRFDGYNFDGSLSDVAFFNTVLSQSQIQNDMSNGVAVGAVTPEITLWAQPQNVLAIPGQTATFSVAPYVTGGSANLFTFQWQNQGGNITGATNSAYTTPPLALADNGEQFDCLVSYPGSSSLTSSTATLTVKAPITAIWTNLAGGSWTNTNSWSNNVVPDILSATADFSELTLSQAPLVTLDGSPTVGNLIFGDMGNTYPWEIDPGSGGTLMLSATNTPTITVLNQSATITAPLATTGGLVIGGNGTLALSAQDVLGGGVTVNGGTLVFQPGGVFDAHGASSLTINNGATAEWNGTANFDGIINGPLPITVNAGGILEVTARSTMGYDYPANYANITLNGGTLALLADQYINTITLNGGTVTGPGGVTYWYAIPTAIICTSNATIASAVILNNNFLATIDVSPGQTLTIGYFQSPGGSVILTGGGTILVTNDTSAQYPYTGLTTISNGTMIVNALLGYGPVDDFGTLGGTGIISNSVDIEDGGTLMVNTDVSPGAVVRTLTIANGLTLHAGSTSFMRITKTGGAATHDAISAGSFNYAGTLVVSNITSDTNRLAPGDTFTLFEAATNYTGNFTATNLPALGSGLAWNWTPTNGTLAVMASTAPVLTSFGPLTNGSFSLTFSGANGHTYSVLMTTNLALPSVDWTVLTNGTFGAGVVNYTNINATNAAQFYEIKSQ
jgi:hypothetical protein